MKDIDFHHHISINPKSVELTEFNSPCGHMVQFYEEETDFLSKLTDYVAGGLQEDQSVILILTEDHKEALTRRLLIRFPNLDKYRTDGQLLIMDAKESLARFMVDGWPSEDLFLDFVYSTIKPAHEKGRKIRAFGEMVAILWEQGWEGATVRLEYLWDKICASSGITLLCAYPKHAFSDEKGKSLQEICTAHTSIVKNSHNHRDSVKQSKAG